MSAIWQSTDEMTNKFPCGLIHLLAGYVCVRGFERKTRAPRPLMARLHFPASKMTKTINEGKK